MLLKRLDKAVRLASGLGLSGNQIYVVHAYHGDNGFLI